MKPTSKYSKRIDESSEFENLAGKRTRLNKKIKKTFNIIRNINLSLHTY